MEIGWISIAPPLLAILVAVVSKRVQIALFLGILFGWFALEEWIPWDSLVACFKSLWQNFSDLGNLKVLFFCGAVGSLITVIEKGGGMKAFVSWMGATKLGNTKRSAGLLSWAVGMLIFVESTLTCLITGAVSRPLYDRLGMSRQKLAFICDSTSAPVCMMIPFNGWGAYTIGLLVASGIESPVSVLVSSLPFNFYSIGAILFALWIVLTGKDFGPMAEAERKVVSRESKESADISGKPSLFFLPITVLFVAVVVGLFITGKGNLMRGSGTDAVFYAVLLSWGSALWIGRNCGSRKLTNWSYQGFKNMIPLVVLVLLAFTLGSVCREMGTGTYLAGLSRNYLSGGWAPFILFVTSCVMAFSTGTSWGTMAVLIPIAVALVGPAGEALPLVIGAVLSGAVFGDHASPLSDTTIAAALGADCSFMDHVRTQLPYSLLVAVVSGLLFLIAGWL